MEKSEKVYAFDMPEKDRQKAENDGSGSLFATNMILFCINLLIIMLVAAAVHWVFHLATYSDSPESEKISELSEALQELKLRMENLTTEAASPEESDYEYEVVSRDEQPFNKAFLSHQLRSLQLQLEEKLATLGQKVNEAEIKEFAKTAANQAIRKLLMERISALEQKVKDLTRKRYTIPFPFLSNLSWFVCRYYYILLGRKMDQNASRDACAERGGQLPLFNSISEEDKALIQTATMGQPLKKFKGAWLDASDRLQEGRFVSDRDGSGLNYTNWHAKEPNNMNDLEHCVVFFGSELGWYDIPCDNQRNVICQVEID